jgi:hypothetical protein
MRKQELLVVDDQTATHRSHGADERFARWRRLVDGLRHDRVPVVSAADVAISNRLLRQAKLWIVTPFASLSKLAGVKLAADLLLPQLVSQPRISFLESIFRKVVAAEVLLSAEELGEALVAPQRAELFVGGTVDWDDNALVLLRGNLEQLSVPFEWFSRLPGRNPDPARFALIDYGNTVKLGDYEAASDAILYDFDPRFRRRARALRRQEDNTLGGSIRRLRNQRGLRQSDFAPISEKEIRRIETGEVLQPQQLTLECIATKLGISPNVLKSY